MTIRKFLHINTIAFIASFVMSHLCYASEVAKPQLTKWDSFKQVASYAPPALLGGYGLYKSLSADGSSSWLPTLALTAAPLWATYLQAKQRAIQRPALQTEGGENMEIEPRTSRWRFAVPVGAAALAASLGAYYNKNWLPGLWWGAGAAAIPALYATGAALAEHIEDTNGSTGIIDRAEDKEKTSLQLQPSTPTSQAISRVPNSPQQSSLRATASLVSNEVIRINDQFVTVVIDNKATLIQNAKDKLQDARGKYTQKENNLEVLLKAYRLLDELSWKEIKVLFKHVNADLDDAYLEMLIKKLEKYEIKVSPENSTNKEKAEDISYKLNAIRYAGLDYIKSSMVNALKNQRHSLEEIDAAIAFVTIYLKEKIDLLERLKTDNLQERLAYIKYAVRAQEYFVEPLKNLIETHIAQHKEDALKLNAKMEKINKSFVYLQEIAMEVNSDASGSDNTRLLDDKLNQAYITLGVNKEDDMESIIKIYRKLALRFHPDKNSEPDANQRFQEISAAFTLIKDYTEP